LSPDFGMAVVGECFVKGKSNLPFGEILQAGYKYTHEFSFIGVVGLFKLIQLFFLYRRY